mgnify:CR=1 FL=1
MFAYELTGGSNLDLPENGVDASGATISLRDAVYTKYDLILCVSTYSATAPLTARDEPLAPPPITSQVWTAPVATGAPMLMAPALVATAMPQSAQRCCKRRWSAVSWW